MIIAKLTEKDNNSWIVETNEVDPVDCPRMIIVVCTLEDDYEVYRDTDLPPKELQRILTMIKNAPVKA
jgi:hypothetical protein